MLYSALRNSIRERVSVNRQDKEVIVSRAIFDLLMRGALASVSVDEKWYLERNPDVRMAVEAGRLRSARQHFVEAGYLEGRLPFAIRVDEQFYLETNPDVRAAFERGAILSAQAHFEETGCREGRSPSVSFSIFGQTTE